MSETTEKTTEDLKIIWRTLRRLVMDEEWETALTFIKSLLDEGDVSSMRMGLNAIKGYEEIEKINEAKQNLRNKIESIIGEIK